MERRTFLKGAAMTGAMAMAGVAGTAMAEEAPVATYECDIVVAGTGIGGMSAIVQAAENGAQVIAVEAAVIPGGNGNGIGGCFGRMSPLQKELGYDFPFSQLISSELKGSQYRTNGELWRMLYDESGANIEWLIGNGVKFSHVDDYGTGGIMTMHHFDGRGGDGYIQPMYAKAQELGVTFMFETKALHPVMDGAKVVGILADGPDGLIQINAKATILATGGFGADSEMVARIGYSPENIWYYGVPTCDGSGWRLGMEAGGKDFTYQSADNAHAYLHSLPHERPDSMPNCGTSMCPFLVWVNQDCKRFVNEDCAAMNFCAQNPPRWNQRDWFFVWNRATFAACSEMYGVPAEEGLAMLDEGVEVNEGGDLFMSDSLDTLGEPFGLDCAALKAEIEKYNQFCASGEDADWVKDPMWLMGMDEGPWYIAHPQTLFLMSIGALFTNKNGQCINDAKDPIEGLYAVGVDGCMLYRNVYTIDAPASCCGNSVMMGRHAADHACAQL